MIIRHRSRLLVLAVMSGAWVTMLASFLWIRPIQLMLDGVLMIGLLPLLLITENMQAVREPLLWWSGATLGFIITWVVWFLLFMFLAALILRKRRPMSSGSLLGSPE